MGRVYQALAKAGKLADLTNEPAANAAGDSRSAVAGSSLRVETRSAESNLQPPDAGKIPKLWSNLHLVDSSAPAFTEPRKLVHTASLRIDPHLVSFTRTDDLARERYHTLAVRTMNLAARRDLKTLLITSAGQGEGKTTVALNFAWVLAKPGERRVLLIEADMRRPSICRTLGLAPPNGLVDLLDRRSTLPEAAVRVDPNRLYLLAAAGSGRQSLDSTADFFASTRIEDTLADLKRQFDVVVIDSPPITEFADAQRLAVLADATMLVVQAGRTSHAAVTDALKLVPKERRLGIVLNDSPIDEELAIHRQSKRGYNRRKQASK